MIFLIKLFVVVAIFITSLSVFIKIKYLTALNTYFINKKQIAIDSGKKFPAFKQKFFALVGMVLTVPIFLVLMTTDLPNELNGLSHGITGNEYADLVLYTKSNDMTATVKEFKEYKKNGFETVRDYDVAKKMSITNIADYKKYKEDEAARNIEAKRAAEQAKAEADKAKAEADKAKELAEKEVEAQQKGFASAKEMWKSQMRDLCPDYMVYRYKCDMANPLVEKVGEACIMEQYKKIHKNWSEIYDKKFKACEFVYPRAIDIDPVSIGLPSEYGEKRVPAEVLNEYRRGKE